MTKKNEIINFYTNGKSVEEIINMGYVNKYVRQVINDYQKINESEHILKSEKKGEKELQNNKTMLKEIERLKNLIYEYEKLNKEKKVKVFKNIKDVEEFLKLLKENSNHIENVEIKISFIWRSNKAEGNCINDKIKKDTGKSLIEFNPIEFYRCNGKEKLLEILKNFDVKELKDIARNYAPDPRGYINKWKDKNKIVMHIFDRVINIAKVGDVFYSKE